MAMIITMEIIKLAYLVLLMILLVDFFFILQQDMDVILLLIKHMIYLRLKQNFVFTYNQIIIL